MARSTFEQRKTRRASKLCAYTSKSEPHCRPVRRLYLCWSSIHSVFRNPVRQIHYVFHVFSMTHVCDNHIREIFGKHVYQVYFDIQVHRV